MYFEVEGGNKLKGEITPSGNKNEALPVIAAVLLTEEKVVLENVPDIKDTNIMIELAISLGVKVEKLGDHKFSFKADNLNGSWLDSSLSSRIRSSLLYIAPLLARFDRVELPSSGGDKIGRRRVDTHLLAFERFGAKITIDDEIIISKNSKLNGNDILLDEASVMATENAIMLAVVSHGITTIYNAACEPHVQGLCNMLNKMGARISGVGTNLLTISGVNKLNGTTHKILPDHIEIGSFIGLAIATSSEIKILNSYNKHIDVILPTFRKLGVEIIIEDNKHLFIPGNQKFKVIDDIGGKIPVISDQPWPCFPADLTSIMVVASLFSEGTIMVHEKMFEGRLFFTDSLIRMGGKIVLCDPHRVVINGPSKLKAIELSSPDIRAGMTLLIAALAAEGKSVIQNIKQIDRGYENIEDRLNKLGAKITRIMA